MQKQPETLVEMLDLITNDLSANLNAGSCKSMRFVLTVWCDCEDEPVFSAANDQDIGRVIKMMKAVTDSLMESPPVEPVHVGHA